MLTALVVSVRPRQWVKNVLVFAAPAAGGALDDGRTLALTCLTFVAFVLVSAATYLLNDVADAEADRRHPVKRERPIAAGVVSVRAGLAAVVVAGLLAAAGPAQHGRQTLRLPWQRRSKRQPDAARDKVAAVG